MPSLALGRPNGSTGCLHSVAEVQGQLRCAAMQLYFLVRLKLVVSKIVLRLLTLGIWLPSGQAPGQQHHDYTQQHVGISYKTLVLYAPVRFRLSQASLI